MARCAALAIIVVIQGACGNAASPSAPQGSASAKPQPGSASPWDSAGSAKSPTTPKPEAGACEALAFAESTPVPEASGAAWLTVDGKAALLVISDSGNHGAYAIVDADDGATIETGKLPLSDATSDDLEGVAARGDRFYGITSSGWLYVWKRAGKGFELEGAPYALGPVTLPIKGSKRKIDGDGMVCPGPGINCGRNYEGLCLAPLGARGACAGFAAGKKDGALYCIVEEAGKLVVRHAPAIEITGGEALADCAFSDDGTLWVGSNLFDLGNAYRITGWQDPTKAQVERVGALAVGFPETIAARGDVVYRMSDMGGAPSLMAKYRCPPKLSAPKPAPATRGTGGH